MPTRARTGLIAGLAIALLALLCGCTASIHDAALRADLAKVESLLAANPALVNAQAGRGKTPLHQAITSGNDDMVALLLEKGADPNARDVTGMTPLHVAASWAPSKRARLLVDGGADLRARDAIGNTPLHEAALHGRVSMSYFLLESGADPNLTNTLGETPLDLAEKGRFSKLSELLRSRAARR